MRPLRLIIEATSCDERPSGALRRHLELWPRVLEAAGAQLEIVLLTSPGAAAQLRAALPGCELIEVAGTPSSALGRRRVNRLLRQLFGAEAGPTLIHQETLPVALPEHTIFCRHDDRLFDAGFSNLGRRLYAATILPRVVRRLAALVTPSEYTRLALAEKLGLGAERIRVVPNGIDPEAFLRPADLERVLAQRGLVVGGYRLVIGHLEPRKNQAFALEVEARLAARGIGGQLVLLGRPGRDSEALASLARKLGIEGRLRILDRKSDDERLAILHGAAHVLQPSLLEGFSLVPLEALACGRPLIASAIPAHLEVLGEAFCRPLEVETWVETIVKRPPGDLDVLARQRLERFPWSRAASSMLELLKDLSDARSQR